VEPSLTVTRPPDSPPTGGWADQ